MRIDLILLDFVVMQRSDVQKKFESIGTMHNHRAFLALFIPRTDGLR